MARRKTDPIRDDTLAYIQAMLGQLGKMAVRERYDMLAYLIEMAHVEANDIAAGARPAHARDASGDRDLQS